MFTRLDLRFSRPCLRGIFFSFFFLSLFRGIIFHRVTRAETALRAFFLRSPPTPRLTTSRSLLACVGRPRSFHRRLLATQCTACVETPHSVYHQTLVPTLLTRPLTLVPTPPIPTPLIRPTPPQSTVCARVPPVRFTTSRLTTHWFSRR